MWMLSAHADRHTAPADGAVGYSDLSQDEAGSRGVTAPLRLPMDLRHLSKAPLQLYFIRHGETAWSLTGQHTGRTELPLTANGQAMALQLRAALSGLNFALVLTSPRLRARATCDAAGLGAKAQIEPRLSEWDYGEYEGLRTAEIRAIRPGWSIWKDGCPGGEGPADLGSRADRLIEQLCGLTGKVALFSHGQFGRVLAARWIGLPIKEGQHLALDPASISMLSHDAAHPRRRVISLWNVSAAGLT
jgi:broad specificity phosphatase PhoE